MNITETSGTWRVTPGMISNRKTGEARVVTGIPSANEIAYMSEQKFVRKCEEAFASGTWPVTYWKSGRVTG